MSYKRSKPLSLELSKEVIADLDGTSEVALQCRVTSAAVSQWKKNGLPGPQIRFLRERFKNHPVMKNESICVGLYSIIGCFNKVLAIGYEVGDSKKGMGD